MYTYLYRRYTFITLSRSSSLLLYNTGACIYAVIQSATTSSNHERKSCQRAKIPRNTFSNLIIPTLGIRYRCWDIMACLAEIIDLCTVSLEEYRDLLRTCIAQLKGIPLRSSCKTHFIENLYFLVVYVCTALDHYSGDTLICRLSVGNSFKTCIISVEQGKALQQTIYIPCLNRIAKLKKHILRYHNISFDILNTLVATNIEFREETHDQTAVDK